MGKFAGDLRTTHSDFVYTPHRVPQALHNAGRLAWGSGPRGEKPDYTGLDVIIVRGDKIAALYVFIDSVPSWPVTDALPAWWLCRASSRTVALSNCVGHDAALRTPVAG